jgi:hypothetical protein
MNDSKNKMHVTETPDVSYIKNVDVTHETSDVYVAGIARFVIGLFVLTVATFFLVWGMFHVFEARVKEPKRSPMALSGTDRLPPEPRLQGAPGFGEGVGKTAKTENPEVSAALSALPKNPLWEIQEVRKKWQDVLENGPVDKDGNRFGMPIEKAKEEIVKQGLPASPQTADGRKP